jgi:prepilin-type N-terminal cleavage/methylation domain-containing protein
MKSNNKKHIQAFTLVELAIVIVVLGILVGGVLTGQSIINSAKRQSVINDVNRYSMGLRAFQLEYGQMPGDFEEAQDYWPDAVVGNGNGDKIITPHSESFFVWEHLYLAGIINQNLDGANHSSECPGNTCLVQNVNCPITSYDDNCWLVMSPYPHWTNPPLKRAN